MRRTVLIAATRLLHADGDLAPGWIGVEGATITGVGRGEPPPGQPADVVADVVAPGFVDVHCHGGGGASFSTTDPAEALRALSAHRALGTTTVVAGVVTDTIATMAAQVSTIADLVEAGEMAGIHLEGPWLSRRFAGAHPPDLLHAPHPDEVDALIGAGRGTVRMVTLAPELDGALDTVRRLVGHGITVAAGHTDADAAVAVAAIDAGARMATHLFNAMRPVHHRAPGPVPVLLGDDRMVVELIADGVHVHPAVLTMAARAARGGYALVTDAFAGALAPDGPYRLGGLEVVVSGGVARLAGTDTLASSTLSLLRAVQVMVAAGTPLPSALLAASATPARTLGLDGVGELVPGSRADVVVLGDDLGMQAVMRAGRWLDAPS